MMLREPPPEPECPECGDPSGGSLCFECRSYEELALMAEAFESAPHECECWHIGTDDLMTRDDADIVAEALLDDASMGDDMVRAMWRAAAELSRVGADRAEVNAFIAALMFGNALLRIRESMDGC